MDLTHIETFVSLLSNRNLTIPQLRVLMGLTAEGMSSENLMFGILPSKTQWESAGKTSSFPTHNDALAHLLSNPNWTEEEADKVCKTTKKSIRGFLLNKRRKQVWWQPSIFASPIFTQAYIMQLYNFFDKAFRLNNTISPQPIAEVSSVEPTVLAPFGSSRLEFPFFIDWFSWDCSGKRATLHDGSPYGDLFTATTGKSNIKALVFSILSSPSLYFQKKHYFGIFNWWGSVIRE